MKVRLNRGGRTVDGTVTALLDDDRMEVVTDDGQMVTIGSSDQVEVLPTATDDKPPVAAGGPELDRTQAVIISDIGDVDITMPPDLSTVPPLTNVEYDGGHGDPIPPVVTVETKPYIIVKVKGAMTTYHSRTDCGKVGDRETMRIDQEQVDFMELELCSFCARKDSQISFSEALSDELGVGLHLVEAAMVKLHSRYGFKARPDAVDRDAEVD